MKDFRTLIEESILSEEVNHPEVLLNKMKKAGIGIQHTHRDGDSATHITNFSTKLGSHNFHIASHDGIHEVTKNIFNRIGVVKKLSKFANHADVISHIKENSTDNVIHPDAMTHHESLLNAGFKHINSVKDGDDALHQYEKKDKSTTHIMKVDRITGNTIHSKYGTDHQGNLAWRSDKYSNVSNTTHDLGSH